MLGKNFAGVWPEAAGGTSPWKRAFLCPFAKSAVAPAYRELAEPTGKLLEMRGVSLATPMVLHVVV